MAEAQGLATRWRWECKNLRAHVPLQGRTPLKQLKQLLHERPSHCAWTNKGAHVSINDCVEGSPLNPSGLHPLFGRAPC